MDKTYHITLDGKTYCIAPIRFIYFDDLWADGLIPKNWADTSTDELRERFHKIANADYPAKYIQAAVLVHPDNGDGRTEPAENDLLFDHPGPKTPSDLEWLLKGANIKHYILRDDGIYIGEINTDKQESEQK